MRRKYLNKEEFDWLNRLESATGGQISNLSPKLNDWERIFMEGILENFKRYGMNTIVSKGQWNVLARISEKIL